MSFLFGKPDTSAQKAAIDAQNKQLELQRLQIEKQEERQKAEETETAKRMQASARARMRGGARSLVSDEREDAMMGIGTSV
jgi:hypothetical protein